MKFLKFHHWNLLDLPLEACLMFVVVFESNILLDYV